MQSVCQIIKADEKYRSVIENLMQFYIYDFSKYVDLDVEEDGLYKAYPYLDDYWKDESYRFAYVLKSDENYIGFVLVRLVIAGERKYFSIAEFFIMRKYRRKGIGKAVAGQMFNLHRGQWEVYQMESNKPAVVFWTKVITEYTKGQFKERFENGKRIQTFESHLG